MQHSVLVSVTVGVRLAILGFNERLAKRGPENTGNSRIHAHPWARTSADFLSFKTRASLNQRNGFSARTRRSSVDADDSVIAAAS